MEQTQQFIISVEKRLWKLLLKYYFLTSRAELHSLIFYCPAEPEWRKYPISLNLTVTSSEKHHSFSLGRAAYHFP